MCLGIPLEKVLKNCKQDSSKNTPDLSRDFQHILKVSRQIKLLRIFCKLTISDLL